MLAFAGLEPSVIESGILQLNGKMVKHCSGHLRYAIMNIAMTILRYSPTFYDYYLKKRSESKCHRVALSTFKILKNYNFEGFWHEIIPINVFLLKST